MTTRAIDTPQEALRMPRAAAVRVDAALAEVAELETEIRAAQARQYELIAAASAAYELDVELAEGLTPGDHAEFVRRSLVAEVATAVNMHERSAIRLIDDAEMLAVGLRETRAALAAGVVSVAHVREVIAQAESVPPSSRPRLEAALLEQAAHRSAAAFRRVARRLRERLHPESIAARREVARADRRLWVEPAEDGMAWLHLFVEAERAYAIERRFGLLATQAAGGPRVAASEIVDLMVGTLLCGTTATAPGGAIDDAEWIRVQAAIRPSVHVTVPVLSLLGADVTPAELDGYGPIDQDTAARLAAQAPSFTRILTHPETGAFLSYGRNSYRVPSDLAGYLRVRDGTCRFPGCTVAAWRTELDHTSGWAEGGATSAENLACLCPKHHRLKHRGGWRVRQVGGASLEWTSPSGREYRTEPERALIGGAQGVEEAMHRARTGHRSG
ncbi:MAG TPA: DUF222 domain-containing protein [Agromyces mariniharenae]|nr:DUF222 domain-containing protein [Agromyces mariniharenae]